MHRTDKYSQHSLIILKKLASLAKWLSVRLQNKWLWVQIPLLSIPQLFEIFLNLPVLKNFEKITRKHP